MELRYEWAFLPIRQSFRMLHISDVHFSAHTTHEKNLRIMDEIMAHTDIVHCPLPEAPEISTPLRAVCITGDLVTRKYSQESLDDAVLLMRRLREFLKDAEIYYSLGNHETDMPDKVKAGFLHRMRDEGICVLDNARHIKDGICFVGLTLPSSVYKNPRGGYTGLSTITREMVENCAGPCEDHPCVLLSHTPLGYPAYAEWGADVVLSGHIHGGIVRIGQTGLLSPERRFLPKYTKGMFKEGGCAMNVSAGIGKFRINNPPEVVCIDLKPEMTEAENYAI